MTITTYQFNNAVSAFFEMDTETAREILPNHLQPMEVRHGTSIFAITAFDFTESMVGAYDEVVLAVIVQPRIEPGGELPKAAFFPFAVGTNTPESRQHAIDRWHLPHYMKDISVWFDETEGSTCIKVREGDAPILELTITERTFNPAKQLYQSFMVDGNDQYKVDLHMLGDFSVHEEETGQLELYDHPMCAPIIDAEIASYPFRELWMKRGRQEFQELETL